MSVNLKEFLLKELKFFPFLLQQDHDQVYIATESLYPFLISKERNEVYILQNLLDSNLWELFGNQKNLCGKFECRLNDQQSPYFVRTWN
jgi:hypothetical protein